MQSRGRVTRQQAPILVWFYFAAVTTVLVLFITGTWAYRALSAEKLPDNPLSDYTACLIETVQRVDDLKSDPREIALRVEPLCDEAYTVAKMAFARDWTVAQREKFMADRDISPMGVTLLQIETNRRTNLSSQP